MSEKPYTAFLLMLGERRFFNMLVSILLLLLLVPLLEGWVALRVLTDICLSGILVAIVNTVSREKRRGVITILLSGPFLFSIWMEHFYPSSPVRMAGGVFGILLFGFALVSVLSYILHQKEVTPEVIFGAIVGYLVIGLTWGMLFAFLEGIHPTSFDLTRAGGIAESRLRFIYFSFVTLTTLGYGDLTPLTGVASALSILEAIAGQIYIAVIIARLVALHTGQQMKS